MSTVNVIRVRKCTSGYRKDGSPIPRFRYALMGVSKDLTNADLTTLKNIHFNHAPSMTETDITRVSFKFKNQLLNKGAQ